ncbi:hypothetical protein JB92DRAFT_3070841 [Gautieria morchelliformis]|nr:hypothetical protein JB92DRAFT_3070841 [Gautieria morchelliformis]
MLTTRIPVGRYNHTHDVHLVAYMGLLRFVSRFHEKVYSDPKPLNNLNKVCHASGSALSCAACLCIDGCFNLIYFLLSTMAAALPCLYLIYFLMSTR